MYGTVMIARPKISMDEFRAIGEKWSTERTPPPGWVDTMVMAADDGRIVMAVRFDSKESYAALADDPGQDEWYRTVLAPAIEGEPEWIDGHWESM